MVRTYITCDHKDCTNRFDSQGLRTPPAAVAEATGYGWRRMAGKDICPEHAKQFTITWTTGRDE